MNIFILNPGRSGSYSFIKACGHITNYGSGHETRCHIVGEEHMAYPTDHIEADNRLTWFLGRLDKAYGDNAMYVNLTRNRDVTAKSFTARYDFGILKAYRDGIILNNLNTNSPMETALDYLDTVKTNIELFLKDKTNVMDFRLENAQDDFKIFWEKIGAEGNLENALNEWNTPRNTTADLDLSRIKRLQGLLKGKN